MSVIKEPDAQTQSRKSRTLKLLVTGSFLITNTVCRMAAFGKPKPLLTSLVTKDNRRTMDFIRHMRRSAISVGRPGVLIAEITWKGNMQVGLSDEKRKTLGVILMFLIKEKDFVPFQIGFRSLPAKYEKYLPI